MTSDRLAFPAGQAGATTMGPTHRVAPPKRHVAIPSAPLDSVRIVLERSQCYGACPSYSIELRGDGTASYQGDAFVLVDGRHASTVDKATVACLLADLRKADFWSLAEKI